MGAAWGYVCEGRGVGECALEMRALTSTVYGGRHEHKHHSTCPASMSHDIGNKRTKPTPRSCLSYKQGRSPGAGKRLGRGNFETYRDRCASKVLTFVRHYSNAARENPELFTLTKKFPLAKERQAPRAAPIQFKYKKRLKKNRICMV